MNSNMFQGEVQYTPVKDKKPHPPIQALKQGSIGKTMSDLQYMQSNERKQHQEAYNYEFGHNDHGMGQ